MKYLLLKVGILAGIVFVLAGCYPGGAEYTSDTDIVVTDYNPDYNFESIETYFLADSVQYVQDGEDQEGDLFPDLVDEFERQFDNLGWTRLDSSDANGPEPDVTIVMSIIKNTNYNVYSYPWYPGWGWGWYWKSSNETAYYPYYGYGWYYPYYPTYVTSYETGTVFWRLFDPENVDEDDEIIQVEWMGAINGLVGSSTQTTRDRIEKGIEQAFTQSPYLSGN